MFKSLATYIACLVLFVGILASAQADTLQTKSKELKTVTNQILGLQSVISKARIQQSGLEHQLKQIETKIGGIAKQLGSTEEQLQQQNTILTNLKKQQLEHQQDLSAQRELLAQQVRQAYVLGQHEYLKLILNQKNPNDVSRLITYYKYISHARMAIMLRLDKILTALNETKQAITKHSEELQQLEQRQQHEQSNLESELHQREAVLTQVNETIKSKSDRLKNLKANKKALEVLVKRLKLQASEFQQPKLPFAKMRGKLIWPTKGKITKSFDSTIDDTSLKYNAVLISAKVGQPIRAVYPGRVVFANWLRGIGLLIIVEHGGGFLTLYGHDHSLYAKTGETVKAGQVIATVGKSGGYSKSGLYFQIRDKGKPLNPQSWCKK